MQRLKLLGLALVAVFAFSAAVTAVASAEEVSFLPEAPVKFAATSGAGQLQILNAALKPIKCTKDKGSGATTTKDEGTFIVEFEGCETELSGLKVKCADLGQTSDNGIIKLSGNFDLRMGLTGQPLGIMAFLVSNIHFLCSIALFTVSGCAAGSIEKLNELVSSLSVVLKQAAGENEILSIDNLAETAMEECTLLTKKGSETAETSGEETSETLNGFTKGGVSTTVLIHA
jgi:hypothetical protein